MYYKIEDRNGYFSVNGGLNVRLNLENYTISKVNNLDMAICKDLYGLVETTQEEYNTALQHILDTLKINKFNFQFNGKK
jgi:hypothetical protein